MKIILLTFPYDCVSGTSKLVQKSQSRTHFQERREAESRKKDWNWYLENRLRINNCNGRQLQYLCRQVLFYETCTLVLYILIQCKQETSRWSWKLSKHENRKHSKLLSIPCFPLGRLCCPSCHLVQAGEERREAKARMPWGDLGDHNTSNALKDWAQLQARSTWHQWKVLAVKRLWAMSKVSPGE